jgi:hypothetical protein
MSATRLMIPTAALAGLLAAALLAVTTSVTSAQTPPVTAPSVPEVTAPELPEVTLPPLPEAPLPPVQGVVPGLDVLSGLMATANELLSSQPGIGPQLGSLFKAVVDLLTGLLGGAVASEVPGAAPAPSAFLWAPHSAS